MQTLIIVIEIQCIVQIYLALICGECHALLEVLFTQGGGAQLGMALLLISDFLVAVLFYSPPWLNDLHDDLIEKREVLCTQIDN